MKKLTVTLLMTGDELMTGDITDTNSVMIAQYLKDIGLEITKKVTVADDLALLSAEIKSLSAVSDILVVNGGLGPTIDDLTAQALAAAANVNLEKNQQAISHLIQWTTRRNSPLNTPNLKQAILPIGCEIVANDVGSAVGFKMNLNHCNVICTPGVPSELKHMLMQHILPLLVSELPTEQHIQVRRLQIFGIGESALQALIDKALPEWPSEIDIGFRAASSSLELKFTTRSKQALSNKQLWLDRIKVLLGDHVLEEIVTTSRSLAEIVVDELRQQKLTVTTAESCTGGLIASEITSIAGASSIFEAGYITYSNNMKNQMIAVPTQTLEQHGAVSKATVIAMANGALAAANSDYAIAVSGIAGPAGGSKEKPVGSVWIAWGNQQKMHAQYFCISGSRHYFQKTVAYRSLDLLRRMLINSNEIPHYSNDLAENID
jgi:nicotinamide-nucleotide amidase